MALHTNPRFHKLALIVIITICLAFAWPRTRYVFNTPSSVSPNNTALPEASHKASKKPVTSHRPPPDRPHQGWFSQPKKHEYSVKPIAYIFPGFHYSHDNELPGTSWSEWDNVNKSTYNRHGLEILRPSSEIGYYDDLELRTRQRQGRYLAESGFYGAAFQYYWQSGKPVMDEVLSSLHNDGEPDIPFMLSWSNEAWTTNSGAEHGEAQDYGHIEDWRAHFDWLSQFFRHPKYIRSEGRVQIVVHNVERMGRVASRMFPAWRQWALEEGLGGLDIIEIRSGGNDPDDAGKALPDAVSEFQPYTAGNFIHAGYHTKRKNSRVYHRSTMVCWDVSPRMDNPASVNPLCHPTNWQFHVVEILGKIKSEPNPAGSENFFFVNALNDWGKGCVLEPSAQFGNGYGKAMKNALKISEEIHPWVNQLITEGLERNSQLESGPKASNGSDVCVIVRTTSVQSQTAIFNLPRMLASLQAMKNKDWIALVVQIDQSAFEGLEDLVFKTLDSRIRLAKIPEGTFPADLKTGDYPAEATDWVIEKMQELHPLCASAKYLLITDGKDTYEPSAFDVVSHGHGDLIGLNYESFRTIWNAVVHTERCIPLQRSRIQMYEPSTSLCSRSSRHARGGIPLGSLFINLARFQSELHKLAAFPPGQPQSQDDHMVDMLRDRAGWEWEHAPDDGCQYMENPTYTSCIRTGNFWLDSPIGSERGCYGVRELQERFGDDLDLWDLQYYRENGGCLRYKPVVANVVG